MKKVLILMVVASGLMFTSCIHKTMRLIDEMTSEDTEEYEDVDEYEVYDDPTLYMDEEDVDALIDETIDAAFDPGVGYDEYYYYDDPVYYDDEYYYYD